MLEFVGLLTVMLPLLLIAVGLCDYYRKAHQLSELVLRYSNENSLKLLRLRTGNQVYVVYLRADNEGGCGDSQSFSDSFTKITRQFLEDFNRLNLCDGRTCDQSRVGLQIQVYSPLVSEIDSRTLELKNKPGWTEDEGKSAPSGLCQATADGIKLKTLWRYYGTLAPALSPASTKLLTDYAPVFSIPTSMNAAQSLQNYGVSRVVDGSGTAPPLDPAATPIPRNFVRHAPILVVGAVADIRHTFAGRAMCAITALNGGHGLIDCWGSNAPERLLMRVALGAPRKQF